MGLIELVVYGGPEQPCGKHEGILLEERVQVEECTPGIFEVVFGEGPEVLPYLVVGDKSQELIDGTHGRGVFAAPEFLVCFGVVVVAIELGLRGKRAKEEGSNDQ